MYAIFCCMLMILSDVDETLQRILDLVPQYGSDLNIRFVSEKSQVLGVNGETVM